MAEPASHYERVGRALVAVSLAAGGLALAGCETGYDDGTSKPGNAFSDLKGLPAETATTYAEALVTRVLDPNYVDDSDVKTAEAIVHDATRIDPAVRSTLSLLIGLRDGQAYVRGVSSADTAADDIKDIPQDVSLADRSKIATAIEEDAVLTHDPEIELDVTESNYALATKKINAAHISASAKKSLLQAVEKQISDDMLDAIDSEDTPAAAFKLLQQIKDPRQKALATALFENKVAQSVLDYGYGDRQTKRLVRMYIHNPALRKSVLGSITETDNNTYDLIYKLPDEADKLQKAADDYNATAADLNGLNTSNLDDAFNSEYTKLRADVDKVLVRYLSKQNAVPAAAPTEVLPAVNLNPMESVDLTGVQGKTTIKDMSTETGLGGYNSLPNLHEFANVDVVNGEITLQFTANDKLTDKAKSQIQAVFEHVKPLLTAAFRNGTLSKVRFTIADQFNPYYMMDTREENLVLAADDQMSVNQLESAWTHETIHSLVNNLFNQEHVTPEDTKLLVNACGLIEDRSLHELQFVVRYVHDDLIQLQHSLPKKFQPIISAIISDAEKGKLATTLSMDDYWKYTGSITNNACDNEQDALRDALTFYAGEKNIDLTDKDYDLIFNNPGIAKVADLWQTELLYSIIHTKLNESNYVETNSADKPFLGHSQDNSNELAASLLDAVLTFPTPLGKVIAHMNDRDRHATIYAVDAFATIIVSQNPQLKQIVTESVAKVKAAIRNA